MNIGFYQLNSLSRWSISTASLMFIPCATCTAIEIVNYSIKKWQGKTDGLSLKASLLRISRHIPFAQPIFHLSAFLKLKRAKDEIILAQIVYKSIDIEKIKLLVDDAEKLKFKKQVETTAKRFVKAKETYTQILTDFQELKIFEAFGEAAPQAILQFADEKMFYTAF